MVKEKNSPILIKARRYVVAYACLSICFISCIGVAGCAAWHTTKASQAVKTVRTIVSPATPTQSSLTGGTTPLTQGQVKLVETLQPIVSSTESSIPYGTLAGSILAALLGIGGTIITSFQKSSAINGKNKAIAELSGKLPAGVVLTPATSKHVAQATTT
jgi:hypothetical protein